MDQATITFGFLIFGLIVAAAISYGTAFKHHNWKRPALAAQGALLLGLAAWLLFNLIEHLIKINFQP